MPDAESTYFLPIRGPERIANLAFGLSFFSWAVLGLTQPEDAGSVVRWCIAALHVTAGVLIINRRAGRLFVSNLDLLFCVPAVISAGLAFHLAGPTDQWPGLLVWLFLGCTVWTIVSLSSLGRSFAVFPSLRSIVNRGPFRWIRHPAYLGELGLVVVCAMASDWAIDHWKIVLSLVFAVVAIAIRIWIEESLLSTQAAYQQYRSAVRWRLLPGIW